MRVAVGLIDCRCSVFIACCEVKLSSQLSDELISSSCFIMQIAGSSRAVTSLYVYDFAIEGVVNRKARAHTKHLPQAPVIRSHAFETCKNTGRTV